MDIWVVTDKYITIPTALGPKTFGNSVPGCMGAAKRIEGLCLRGVGMQKDSQKCAVNMESNVVVSIKQTPNIDPNLLSCLLIRTPSFLKIPLWGSYIIPNAGATAISSPVCTSIRVCGIGWRELYVSNKIP